MAINCNPLLSCLCTNSKSCFLANVSTCMCNPPSSPWHGRCASPELCITTEDGLLVNPCKRIGIVAECISYCQEPHQYQWEARLEDGTPLPYDPTHFPNGKADVFWFNTLFLHLSYFPAWILTLFSQSCIL